MSNMHCCKIAPALLLGGLLLPAPLRPDHQEVEADEDDHDQEQERVGAA